MDKKMICPLSWAGGLDGEEINCLETRCAWYMQDKGACAIVVLAAQTSKLQQDLWHWTRVTAAPVQGTNR